MKSKKPAARKEIGYSPPLEIIIPSDGTVLALMSNKNGLFTYRYTVPGIKYGTELKLDEEGVKKLLHGLEFSKYIRPAKETDLQHQKRIK